MSSTAAAPDGPSPRPVHFSDLPPELRDLIWEHAAPPPRLFHIHHFKIAQPRSDPPTRRPQFYHLHPPPAITAVCRESRRAALRLGLFLLPAWGLDPEAAVWFSAASDVLYLGRPSQAAPQGGPFHAEGLERVVRVGVEWRRLFRNGSLPVGEYAAPENRGLWVSRMAALYELLPGTRCLHYVLPLVRYQGGVPWGREPDGAAEVEGRLMPLPGRITIPLESGHRPWEEVGREMKRAIGHADVVRGVKERVGEVRFPPDIVGEWLLRDLPRSAFASPSVKEFTW